MTEKDQPFTVTTKLTKSKEFIDVVTTARNTLVKHGWLPPSTKKKLNHHIDELLNHADFYPDLADDMYALWELVNLNEGHNDDKSNTSGEDT